MMKKRTITVDVGPVSLHHNNREFQYYKDMESPDWIDMDKTRDNIIYIRKNPKTMLNSLFKDGVREYNEKQKRKYRRYEKVSDYTKSQCGRKYKWKHELIVQVGGMDDMGVNAPQIDQENARKILDEFANNFQKRFKNFKVFNMVLHLDEATPHLHISYCPVYTEPQEKLKFNGCRTKISLKQAMFDMGYTQEDIDNGKFFKDCREEVETIMAKYGYEYEPVGKNDKDRSAKEQREFMRALERRIKNADKNIDELVDEVSELKQEDISLLATKINTQYRDIMAYKGLIDDNIEEYKEQVKEEVINETNLELKNYRKEEKNKLNKELNNIETEIDKKRKILAQTDREILADQNYMKELDETICRRENQTFDERDDMIDYLTEVIATASYENPLVGEHLENVMEEVYNKRTNEVLKIPEHTLKGMNERNKLMGLENMIKKFKSRVDDFIDFFKSKTKRRTKSDDFER